MIRSITQPENGTVEESFQARAMQPVRDWTSNEGIPYIAQVNPYVAAGMGFANQMANPFKQRYFENKAQANSEEEARRLNYEYARQKQQDDRQKRLDDISEQQRQIDNLVSFEAEDVNIPAMANYEEYMTPEDAAQARAAESLLNQVKEYNAGTLKGVRNVLAEKRSRNQAKSVLNALNLKYAGMGDKISTKEVYDPRKDKNIGFIEKVKRTTSMPEEQAFSLQMQDIVNKGLFGGKLAAALIKFGSIGKESNNQAKILARMNELHKEFDGTGFTGKVVTKDNLEFEPAGNNQVLAKQIQIKKMLDSKYSFVVQMTSPQGTKTETFLVTPDGIQNVSDAIVTTTQMANQDAMMNRAADIRGALGG
jgi:hypothetical protein